MAEENKLMLDIYERLGGIDAKLDNVNAIKQTADDALKIANRADLKADDAQEDISKLTSTLKWGLGICASAIITIIVFVLGIVIK
ncbi:hemolysin XhlA family protein [uncultured Rummeliibacillus sp.]|uniref:hemolysin XhlA family protein n=1 Tax=uncultured Rummeliibacillus sp. TaxID=762292 RepID=UPI002632EF3D|nr:hemolysin XhlA family protein [uncultured Rummeliibacillus sp.]